MLSAKVDLALRFMPHERRNSEGDEEQAAGHHAARLSALEALDSYALSGADQRLKLVNRISLRRL